MNEFVPDIAKSIVSGVVVGLVLAGFFWLKDRHKAYKERSEQITYISELLMDYRKKILNATDVPHPKGKETISVHQVRKIFYNKLKGRLDSAISGRASRLTYDEIESVRRIFFEGYNEVLSDRLFPEEIYVKIFDSAKSLEWLNVLPMTRGTN